MFYAEMDGPMEIILGLYWVSRSVRPAQSVGDHSLSTASSVQVGFLPFVLDLERPARHSEQFFNLVSPLMVTSGVLKMCCCCGE